MELYKNKNESENDNMDKNKVKSESKYGSHHISIVLPYDTVLDQPDNKKNFKNIDYHQLLVIYK